MTVIRADTMYLDYIINSIAGYCVIFVNAKKLKKKNGNKKHHWFSLLPTAHYKNAIKHIEIQRLNTLTHHKSIQIQSCLQINGFQVTQQEQKKLEPTNMQAVFYSIVLPI